MSKLLKDATREEIMEALNLLERGNKNDNKVRLMNKSERVITIEQEGFKATIETDMYTDVTVDIDIEEVAIKEEIEEVEEITEEVSAYNNKPVTEAEIMRSVRFNLKLQSFRQQQAIRAEEEAKKPKLVRQFNKFKEELNKASNKAFDDFIDRLGR